MFYSSMHVYIYIYIYCIHLHNVYVYTYGENQKHNGTIVSGIHGYAVGYVVAVAMMGISWEHSGTTTGT